MFNHVTPVVSLAAGGQIDPEEKGWSELEGPAALCEQGQRG